MKNGRKVRWWMLIYTFAIAILFVVAAITRQSKPKPYHSIAYDIFEDCGVILMLVGNFLYAFGYVRPLLRKLWKLAFPLIIASFVVGGLVSVYFDSSYEKHPPSIYAITWILVFGIFFASFRANFLVGYGDVSRVRTIERPVVMSEDPLRDLVREMTRMRRTAQISWVVVIALLTLVAFNSFFQFHIEARDDSWVTVRRLADRAKYAEALTVARHLIDKEPDSPDLWVLLGNLQLSLGQLHQAEGSYTRAYELLPNQVTASLLNAVRARIDETDATPTPTASP